MTRAMRVALPVTVVAAVVVALVLSLLARGRSAVAESDAALARGDVPVAIALAKRAAQARLPGSPYPDQGYERLFAIAQARAAANDEAGARAAYRAVISAARSTGTDDEPRVSEARAALTKLEGPAEKAPPESTVVSPSHSMRIVFASSVVLLVIGLVWLARNGGKIAWAIFAAGASGIIIAALS